MRKKLTLLTTVYTISTTLVFTTFRCVYIQTIDLIIL